MEFLYALQSIRSPILDAIFSGITNVGGEAVMLVIICLLYWCVNRELAYRAGLAFFISGALVQILKLTFRIERPWLLDVNFAAVESAIKGATGYSFPSGHTQSAVAIYLTLALSAKKRYLRVIFVTLMLTIAFSRMYLGVHTPLDVSVALFVSGTTVAITWLVMRHHDQAITDENGFKHFDLTVASVIAVISFVSLVLCICLRANSVVDYKNAADCAKTAGAGIGFAAGWYYERRFIKFDASSASVPMQIIKLLTGVAVVLILKEGLKALFLLAGENLLLDALRYLVMVAFAIGLYPQIIKKYFTKKV